MPRGLEGTHGVTARLHGSWGTRGPSEHPIHTHGIMENGTRMAWWEKSLERCISLTRGEKLK